MLVLVSGCGRSEPRAITIGDGMPRPNGPKSFVGFVWKSVTDGTNLNLQLKGWSSGDDVTNRSESAQAEVFVSRPDVVAVVGHAGSKGSMIAASVYQGVGMPLVVPTATSSKLRASSNLVFMLSPTDSVEGAFIANQALDSLAARRIAVVYVADAYGTGIRDGVEAQLTLRRSALAGELALAGKECVSSGNLSMRGVARALLARAHPDLVVVATSTGQAACFIEQVRAVDSRVKILAADSFEPAHWRVAKLSGGQRSGVYFVDFWDAERDSRSRDFARNVREALHREPLTGEALNYDAYQVLIAAIKEGHRTRESIAQWLRQLGTVGHPSFPGVTGSISFNIPRSDILYLRRLPAATAARP